MEFAISIFLAQFMVFFNQYQLINGIPIIGHNIKQAHAGQYSYIVSIMRIDPEHRHSGGLHFCTGVLITRSSILTAAHCVSDERISRIQIVVGTNDLTNGSVYHPYWWITYDQWAVASNITIDFDRNDIASVKLLADVPQVLIPVRLSRLSNTELYNAQVITAGWGLNNDGIVPDIMNIAHLQVIENSVCETRLSRCVGPTSIMDTRILCTYVSPYTLLEIGDSGGPLIFRNRLIGINKSTCPGDRIRNNDIQMNLHMCIHFYRTFINTIKRC